jgi:diaminopimelate decarboxylase/aspartate kinase
MIWYVTQCINFSVWVVVSALSKVTNWLLASLEEVTGPSPPPDGRCKSYNSIVEAHEKLAAAMALTPDEYAPVRVLLEDLRRLLEGVRLTQEVSPRLRARVAAFGELLSSQMGLPFLRRELQLQRGAGADGSAADHVHVVRASARGA